MTAKVSITIDCGNAAFEDHPDEFGRVLAAAIFAVNRAHRAGRSDTVALFDTNGNRVGEAHYQHEEE